MKTQFRATELLVQVLLIYKKRNAKTTSNAVKLYLKYIWVVSLISTLKGVLGQTSNRHYR